MAQVLLTHSYFLRFDPKQLKQQQPYPPLGTMYAASVLREAGISIAFYDTMFGKSAEEIIPVIEKENPEYLVLYDDGFNYLTKMCLTNMREAAFRTTQLAKEKGCKVIISSSDSTDHLKEYIDNGADFIIMGEGEITLLELLNELEKHNKPPEAIPGLAFKKDGKIIITGKREVLKNLDILPMPTWDLIDIRPYKEAWINKWGYFSINMATTRGCPYKCNWCAKPIYGNRYNTRSPEKVVDELIYLKQHFSPDHIWFCDDIFGLKPGWVKKFADILEQQKLSLRFKIQCRADLLIQEDFVADLARAGCESVWMGAESGSQKILDAMDKGTKVPQIYEATRLLKKHGIKPAFFLQFGYPGETLDDISLTTKMLLDLMPDDIGISVSYPLPGTVFYEKVKEQLKQKTNWTDSDELALLFKNTYPPIFYKQLHRFVHKIYRGKQAMNSLKNMVARPFSVSGEELKKALSIFYYKPASQLYRWRMRKYEKFHVA
jgi:anaerobic magnesium-protoporphyrin IX monomethyl ester cyclase